MSEVVPEDEDRGGDGAIGEALEDTGAEEDQAGDDSDDGGPGSQNM